jgi:thiamine-phosphate pyrophosphorylase
MAVIRNLPRLYPIVDAGLLARAALSPERFAWDLREAGVAFLQYRNKAGSAAEVLLAAERLRAIFPVGEACLILNDRAALAAAGDFDGVHLGQDDLTPAEARLLTGPSKLIGYSTHTPRQAAAGEAGPADYLAIGPVFPTSSKVNPDPVIGLEGVAAARAATRKPLVAIGGITRENCAAVLGAGADSVAVISGLLPRAGETVQAIVREYRALLGL